MKSLLHRAAIYSLGLAFAAQSGVASSLIVYPKNGQTDEQTKQDKAQCSEWAQQETGINPKQAAGSAAPAPVPTAAAPPAKHGAGRGAAKGAAVGAVGGAIGGDAGKGAAVGAGVGAVAGGARRRQAEKEQEQAQAEQAKAQKQASSKSSGQMATFNKAQKACLEGRGYSVS